MPGIKAIQTEYKGYRFRSRLEARWAVFFDALGVEWEFEKEGFDLGDAGWYLPDFWLPEWSWWIEVKGGKPTAGEKQKCAALAEYCGVRSIDMNPPGSAVGSHVICVSGPPPMDEEPCGLAWAFWLPAQDWERGVPIFFANCRRCSGIAYGSWDAGHVVECSSECDRGDKLGFERIHSASMAARSARFEHGENGAHK